MQIIANWMNGQYLRNHIKTGCREAEEVKAAVAYAGNVPELFEECKKSGTKLTYWGRMDSSIPISLGILKNFLKSSSANYSCNLVFGYLHSKVIWWVGYGAYIGSANLTDRAWNSNMEVGTFYPHEEILENNLEQDLNDIFTATQEHSKPLTEEIYNYIERHQKKQERRRKTNMALDNDFDNNFQSFHAQFPTNVTPKTVTEKRKNKFLDEWNATLQQLRQLAKRISTSDNLPPWLTQEVPAGALVDQFLHAYYYILVREGSRYPYQELHAENCTDIDAAVDKVISWWRTEQTAPSSEAETLFENAPIVKDLCSPDKILFLTEEEFCRMISKVHAFMNHARRMELSIYGVTSELEQLSFDERLPILTKWLYGQRTPSGNSPLELIYYILYGGDIDSVPERLFVATHDENEKIPHLGISALGELIGWAMPNQYPPRNGRTSKALHALGYNVTIHSV
ncbi:phospholipase D-like domain-containing protein [Halodesulfovibrio sp. MK-HDV]|jgi:hypothetical protein|uniref:phospholipase D-like domain-containing protein n=1 Tax=Halodesulfovibrio sp. MK-HDV TaxID=2599925 RepID=UPI00136C933F|nr:phospholipase D-like domain-containing protein [Halodesulfovibrio sp. MK-HDV]KAF1077650.1 hypothetical protein MKHDV_00106 [Halodesulfovibrio sp. MK-HDV]